MPEPYIDGPTVLNGAPGETVHGYCYLRKHDPRDTVTNLRWSLDYSPDWVTIDPDTGVLTGVIPDSGRGNFRVAADFAWTPYVPSKASDRRAKNTDTYAAHRNSFVNSRKLGGDWEAFDKMLEFVTMDLEHDDLVVPSRRRRADLVKLVVLSVLMLAAILVAHIV